AAAAGGRIAVPPLGARARGTACLEGGRFQDRQEDLPGIGRRRGGPRRVAPEGDTDSGLDRRAGRGLMRRIPALVPLLVAALALFGCAGAKDFLGMGSYKTPLPGSRVSVLQLNQSLVADPALADVKVLLPQPFANPDWPQPGGYPAHAMH